ncbi:MAG: hypothetical protein IJB12_04235 [Methanocorpusculum sp.]|nr:hypothetical protein [Methanocorpusculum sp.]
MNLMNTTVPVKKSKQPMNNVSYYSSKIVLLIVFFGVGKLLTVYEKTAPSLGEFFYPATVVIGFFVEIVVLAGLFFIEQNPSYIKENPRPKTSGIVLIIVLLCLAVGLAAAGIIVSIFWHPDMASHAAFTYLLGCIPGAAAACILRYLPHKLPQKEAES